MGGGEGGTTMTFWYVPILISPSWLGMDSDVPRTTAMRWEWALTGSVERNWRQASSPPGQPGGPALRAASAQRGTHRAAPPRARCEHSRLETRGGV